MLEQSHCDGDSSNLPIPLEEKGTARQKLLTTNVRVVMIKPQGNVDQMSDLDAICRATSW